MKLDAKKPVWRGCSNIQLLWKKVIVLSKNFCSCYCVCEEKLSEKKYKVEFLIDFFAERKKKKTFLLATHDI